MAQYFYDDQLRRFMLQFARIFSNFQVEYGANEAGQGPGSAVDTLVRVPVRYGDASRQAQTILQNNSANDMPSTPMMSFYITDLKYDRPRIQDPTFVSTISVRQRTYDTVTDSYETTQGNAFTIDRLMPVPFVMTMNLDIWTSNTNQKMQLLEQILVLFNPALEIQSTDSYIDWTSLTVLELTDIRWSSRTIGPGAGTENPIDIATLTFSLPIWISSPAKIKKLGVIEKIIANIHDARGDLVSAITDSDLLLGTRQQFTPYGYQTLLVGNKIQALAANQVVDEPNAALAPPANPPSTLLWHSIIDLYGVLRPGISLMAFEQEDGSEVYGTISYDPTDDRFLLFTVDPSTIPPNTLMAVDAVINPLVSGPGAGLVPAAVGQRYLLTDDTGSDNGYAEAWAGTNGQYLIAHANDIIEYTGDRWVISFDSTSSPANIQYVTNITTEIQYKWIGHAWVKSFQGLYPGGQWTLTL
jgi:hypothetical protein